MLLALMPAWLALAACSRSDLWELGHGRQVEPHDGTSGLDSNEGGTGAGGSGAGGSGTGVSGAPVGGFGGGAAGGAAGQGASAGSGASGGAGAGATSGAGGAATGGTGTGGSTGGPCATDADCVDLGFCALGVCEDGACAVMPRDADGDGQEPTECGGTDCNDLNPLAFAGGIEVCADGADNDCNGVADCRDPVCAGVPDCGCVPGRFGEICDNGPDDDCDGAFDCNDPDCLGHRACGCAAAESSCTDGIDDDCDGAVDCADEDCASTELCACRAKGETCGNGQDDDCDLRVDCADPDCQTHASCLCPATPGPEICDDFRDQDCDGLVDCADPECFNAPACAFCEAEICDSGEDEDCNGLVDCADEACRFEPGCTPVAEECNDALDNDRDGSIDCLDTDCAQNPYCLDQQSNCLTARRISASGSYVGETIGNLPQTSGTCGGDAGEAVFALTLHEPSGVSLDTIGSDFDTTLYVREGSCSSGREIACDDDTGGQRTSLVTFALLKPGTYFVFVDGFTVDAELGPNEGNFVLNVDLDFEPVEDCTNGIDDDGNVLADCADPSCAAFGACATCNGGGPATAEFGAGACTDGVDNDCDGAVDCADTDCSASDTMTTECCTGTDQNGNGIPDDFNCRCASDADCGTQICYSGTVQACGLRCTRFVGDVCPFLAPGSTCNAATEQCEF